MKTVFAEFAKYLFEKSSAFYDHFYQFINDRINEYNDGQVAIVSWLSQQDKDSARRELRGKALPIVSSNPFGRAWVFESICKTKIKFPKQ